MIPEGVAHQTIVNPIGNSGEMVSADGEVLDIRSFRQGADEVRVLSV